SSHRAALLPDTPAALAALTAVQCGELDVAQSVLERATRVRLGGRAMAVRHRLLLGWIALLRGATAAARAALTDLAALEPRDEFVAAALEVAIARRTGDLAALMPAWARAREAIVRHPVDLFVLQQLGELAIAAARLRETSWIRPHLDEAAGGDRRRVPRGGDAAGGGRGRGGWGQPVRRRAGRGGPALGGDLGRRGRRRRGREGRARAARRRPDVGGRQAR